jgi:hypothetical protein
MSHRLLIAPIRIQGLKRIIDGTLNSRTLPHSLAESQNRRPFSRCQGYLAPK